MHFIRLLYINTNNFLFCTLRAEILMTLHDKGILEVNTNFFAIFLINIRLLI